MVSNDQVEPCSKCQALARFELNFPVSLVESKPRAARSSKMPDADACPEREVTGIHVDLSLTRAGPLDKQKIIVCLPREPLRIGKCSNG